MLKICGIGSLSWQLMASNLAGKTMSSRTLFNVVFGNPQIFFQPV
jgi:hypothetical protein